MPLDGAGSGSWVRNWSAIWELIRATRRPSMEFISSFVLPHSELDFIQLTTSGTDSLYICHADPGFFFRFTLSANFRFSLSLKSLSALDPCWSDASRQPANLFGVALQTKSAGFRPSRRYRQKKKHETGFVRRRLRQIPFVSNWHFLALVVLF